MFFRVSHPTLLRSGRLSLLSRDSVHAQHISVWRTRPTVALQRWEAWEPFWYVPRACHILCGSGSGPLRTAV